MLKSISEIDAFVTGEKSVLDLPKALVLNSRQSKTPIGSESWVRNTIDAVNCLVNNGTAVISSIGMNTWELLLWATREHDGRGIVILPVDKKMSQEDMTDFIVKDFDLNRENIVFIFIQPKDVSKGGKGWWDSRDNFAFQLADEVVPVSIRNNGNWDSLINSVKDESKAIDNAYRTEYENRHKAGSNDEIKILNIPHMEDWDWLTHWTRRFHRAWPGEKSCDFYRAIASSETTYPRRASDTLKKIISEKLLRCSSTRIRGGIGAVAFTSHEPREAVKLMKWRSRFVRYTFEPYGVAIRKAKAVEHGMKSVLYARNGKSIHDEGSGFIQGYGKGDWRLESEWRHIGDLDLRLFDTDDVIIVVPSMREVEDFRPLSDFKVVALEKLHYSDETGTYE